MYSTACTTDETSVSGHVALVLAKHDAMAASLGLAVMQSMQPSDI
jgi:hypothetical protein